MELLFAYIVEFPLFWEDIRGSRFRDIYLHYTDGIYVIELKNYTYKIEDYNMFVMACSMIKDRYNIVSGLMYYDEDRDRMEFI